MSKFDPKEDLTFNVFYPAAPVAKNDVSMSFNSDEQAELFREWWDDVGEAAFAKWFKKQS